MNAAIMQPYFFPYLGYFQLLAKVDTFIFLDDVNFIKRGYINRNQILLNGAAKRFTISVRDSSQNRSIRDHFYTGDYNKFFNLLHQAYKKAPNYKKTLSLIEKSVDHPDQNVATVNIAAITLISELLKLPTSFQSSSELGNPLKLNGEARIVDLCKQVDAKTYLNPEGGRELYREESFTEAGLSLNWSTFMPTKYSQGSSNSDFVGKLSIIDALMFCSLESLNQLITRRS